MKSSTATKKVRSKSGIARSDTKRVATPLTTNEIQLRAYWLYLERGGTDGRDIDDWLQAETELTQSELR